MSVKLATLWTRLNLAWLILSGGKLPEATPAPPPPPPLPINAQAFQKAIQDFKMALDQAFTNLSTAADAFIAECVNHVAEINQANATNATLTSELATANSDLATTKAALDDANATIAAANAAAQAVADKLTAAAAPAPAPTPAPAPATDPTGSQSADVTP